MAKSNATTPYGRNKVRMLLSGATDAKNFLNKSACTLEIFNEWMESKIEKNEDNALSMEISIMGSALDLLKDGMNEAYSSLCEFLSVFEQEEGV